MARQADFVQEVSVAGNRIRQAVRETAQDLHKAGLMDHATLAAFDAVSVRRVRAFAPSEIRRLRTACEVNEATFAAYLNISEKTLRYWEGGKTRPQGASLRLLDIVARKGLKALA
jgi:putative transcriptional regulator